MSQDSVAVTFQNRQDRGRHIAASSRVKKKADSLWVVPSQSHAGCYVVDVEEDSCSCPDHAERGATGVVCKHRWAVTFTRLETVKPDGSVVTQDSMRITYKQDWPAYNKSQCNQKADVEQALHALCSGIIQPEHKNGRPPLPWADVVIGNAMKVFTTLSSRRATTDVHGCGAKGLMATQPHYNSLSSYLHKPELTPLLKTLIEEAATPLKPVESQFAVDATGFTTSTYDRWYDHKWGKTSKKRIWLKCHAMVGCRTNVVTSVEVTKGNRNDSPELPGLVKGTAERFDVGEVSADMAYLAHKNLKAIESVGAIPYIPFKENNTDGGSAAWKRLWHCFWYRHADFERHYHQRSNVETAFSMIKTKFGGNLRSKKFRSQVNEVLLKVLVHNLAVVCHEVNELGIRAEFWANGSTVRAGR